MNLGASRLQAEHGRRYGLRDLFTPLQTLLISGGDHRLAIDPATGLSDYGCAPEPAPEIWEFASSTASTISERAYQRAALAREGLVYKALFDEVEVAFEARHEDMRDELRGHLQLSPRVDIVFSPSGTDSQLHALFLAGAALGAPPVTIVVGSDQTGRGTAHTARGRHFGTMTASGVPVRKDAPVAGLGGDSIALPLLDATDHIAPRGDADSAVLRAIEIAVGRGARVLLQIMDSSKLGWRAPSEACLDEIATRWPAQVQIVVDACQMRLGRRRLRSYLDRGYMVLITGSKYFGGPAFSGALLVPKGLARLVDRGADIPPGLFDYASRSDWPKGWSALRARFESRPNFGQWLRWEAALAEIGSYYAVPGTFRMTALAELAGGIGRMIAATPALSVIASGPRVAGIDDEEFAHATIFPVALHRQGRVASIAEHIAVHRALARDLSGEMPDGVAPQRCLIGQPVRLERPDRAQACVLRLCVGARLVTEAWSPDAAEAQRKLQDILDRIAQAVRKIELLLDRAEPAAQLNSSASGA